MFFAEAIHPVKLRQHGEVYLPAHAFVSPGKTGFFAHICILYFSYAQLKATLVKSAINTRSLLYGVLRVPMQTWMLSSVMTSDHCKRTICSVSLSTQACYLGSRCDTTRTSMKSYLRAGLGLAMITTALATLTSTAAGSSAVHICYIATRCQLQNAAASARPILSQLKLMHMYYMHMMCLYRPGLL